MTGKLLRVISIFTAITLWAPAAPGNGWEHGAVPFAALLKALEDGDAYLRQRAAESLGYRGQPEAVGPLLARLARPEPDPRVRSAIYVALGSLADPRAVAPLGACLAEEDREEVRGDCALALGLLADPAGQPLLLDALADDSILVRSRATDALGSFSTAEAVDALVALLDERGLRARAIRALGGTGRDEAVAPLLAILGAPESANEQLAAIDALGRLAASAARAPLTRLLDRTDEPLTRARIAIALGAIRDGRSLPTLVSLLDDAQTETRALAIDGLRALGDPEAAEPIIELCNAIEARWRGADLMASPEDALNDLALEEAALRALVDLDPVAAGPAFAAAAARRALPRDSQAALLLAEAVYQLRRTALRGLGYSAAPEAFDDLAAASQDADARLRAVAVRSLGVLGQDGTTARLLPRLADEAAEVRWMAAEVLGRIKDQSAAPALLAALGDSVSEVRRQAALALGYLDARAARADLAALAESDPDEKVRAAARYAAGLLAP